MFKEISDHSLDNALPKSIEELCSRNGITGPSLFEHQYLIRNFMSPISPYTSLLLIHSLGTGKCHGKDTSILMYSGEVKMIQDIVVGDTLMGDDSGPRKVQSLARGKDMMYKINPVKGDSYIVNKEHILCLEVSGFPQMTTNNKNFNIQWVENNKFQSKTFTWNTPETQIQQERAAKEFHNSIINEQIMEISVKDYMKLSKSKKSLLKGYRVPISFPEKKIFDPYMIGYWLGDWSSNSTDITSRDSRVLHYFNKTLLEYGLTLVHKDKYGITANIGNRLHNKKINQHIFLGILKKYDLLNNKHIPNIYKCNSRQNRLELLAGLLDAGGSLDRSGGFDFIQKNEKLLNDVVYLCRSLGFSCYKSECKKNCMYNGRRRKDTYYRISINGAGIEEIPTKCPRKKAFPRKQIKDVLITDITVSPIGIDNYYGFVLDKNHRYVLGDCTVTHNSLQAIAVAEAFPKIIVILEESVRLNFLEEYRRFYATKKQTSELEIITLGRFTRMVGESIRTEEGIQLLRDTFSNAVIIIDEIHNIRESMNERSEILGRYDALCYMLHLTENTRLLLMSATPMFDSPTEIVNIINFMVLNEMSRENNISNITKKLVVGSELFDSDENITEQGQKLIEEYLNGRTSYVNTNAVTFPKKMYPESSIKVPGIPLIKIVPCVMSPIQQEEYLKIVTIAAIGNVYNIRIISNLVWGIDSDINLLKIENLKGPDSISGKLPVLYDNVMNTPGPVFIYSEFLSESLNKVADMLSINGWEIYNASAKVTPNKNRYVILYGEIKSKDRVNLLNIYNSDANKDGAVIRAILGTKVLKEGVTLLNTRSVHILEPWFNMSRIRQIEARAIRSCSHVGLPIDQRNVTSYLYASILNNVPIPDFTTIPINNIKNHPEISHDLGSYCISVRKELKIQKIINILRRIAVDCLLHKGYNRNREDGIECINENSDVLPTVTEIYNDNITFFELPTIEKLKNIIRTEIKEYFVYVVPTTHYSMMTAIQQLLQESFKINDISGKIYLLEHHDKQIYLYFKPDDIKYKTSIFESIDYRLRVEHNKFPLTYFLEKTAFNTKVPQPNTDVPITDNSNSVREVTTESIQVFRERRAIKGNYEAIYDTNGEFKIRNIKTSNRNAVGKVCTSWKPIEFHELIESLKIPITKLLPDYNGMVDGIVKIKNKKNLCKNISKYFFSYESRIDPQILNTPNWKIFVQDGVLKFNDNSVNARGGTVCLSASRDTLLKIVSDLGIQTNAIQKKNLCEAITNYYILHLTQDMQKT
jgi:hypothetical protein